MKTILVELSTSLWTNRAIHLACSMARSEADAEVVLLYLNSVPHPSYLGTPMELFAPTPTETEIMNQATATAEDYGITLTLEAMAYATSRLDAISEAADTLNADAVFAEPTHHPIPLWSHYQWSAFTRTMEHGGHMIYTITQTEKKAHTPIYEMVANLILR